MDDQLPPVPRGNQNLLASSGRPQVPPHPVNTISFNERGLRSGWRIVTYLFQILILSFAFNFLPKTATPPMWQMFLEEALAFLIVFLPALVMTRLEARPAGDYGLPARSMFSSHFWHGA